MKSVVKGLSFLAILFGATLALAGTIKEYSADTVDVKTGKVRNREYVTPTKMRIDSYDEDGKLETIDIIRIDHKKRYFFYVDNKTYFEFPLKGEIIPERNSPEWKEFEKTIMGEFAPQTIEEKISAETVNGYKTEKFRVTTRMGELPASVSYEWYAKEFDTPVRTQSGEDEGDDIQELRNIKVGAPAASLFELPSGYKLTSVAR